MWLVASSLLLLPPAPAPADLSVCDTGTLPAQVIGIATDPMEVFLLAPYWGDARFEERCRQLHSTAGCDPARFVYPTREAVAEVRDLAGTALRTSIVLQAGSPLEGRIEGFADDTQRFTFAFDLVTGAIDERSSVDRWREVLLRSGFVAGTVAVPPEKAHQGATSSR